MKILKDIISEELFVNAFYICKTACEKEFILDVNLLLLKSTISKLTEAKVISFYNKYVETDLYCCVPEFFATDVVYVPKAHTGTREYRFFTSMGIILYTAVGLLFVDVCYDTINNLDFSGRKIFAYYPTKFSVNKTSLNGKKKWNANNQYKQEYPKFVSKLEDSIGQNNVILEIDISQYFNSIEHSKLVSYLTYYGEDSYLKKYGYDSSSGNTLQYYLTNIMNGKYGIPQGKSNIISDFFGYIYLTKFDIFVKKLLCSTSLKFKSMIRYVDDIYIIFSKENIDEKYILKELLGFESKISAWLQKELNLTINPKKTRYTNISTNKDKDIFLENCIKKLSTPIKTKRDSAAIQKDFDKVCQSISLFNYEKQNNLKFEFSHKDKENLKKIFDNGVKDYCKKQENIIILEEIISHLNFELTVNEITILMTLFGMVIKNKQPFLNAIYSFFKKELNLADKRHIHIFLVVLAQTKKQNEYKRIITKQRSYALADDYGKYACAIFNINRKKDGSYFPTNEQLVYQRIFSECDKGKLPHRGFLYNDEFLHFPSVIRWIIKRKNIRKYEPIINQIKDYVYNINCSRYDLAFNNFHSMFHQIMKISLHLKDSDSVSILIKKLSGTGIEEELLISKFYSRRNFNLISHPSQKGTPSVKASKNDLLKYITKILPIIDNILT